MQTSEGADNHSSICLNYPAKPLVAQTVKNLPAMQKTWVRSLGWEDPLEEGMATHSSILVWRIPWTEELVGYSPWDSPGQNTGVGGHSLTRGSSQPRDPTQVSCIAGRFLTIWVTREAHNLHNLSKLHMSARILNMSPKNTGVGRLSLLQGIFPTLWCGVSCIAGEFFTSWATREAQQKGYVSLKVYEEIKYIWQK